MDTDRPSGVPNPGHQPFHTMMPPEFRICRYCIQPVDTPVCEVQPGNPERPPLNPAVVADLMAGISPTGSMGHPIATAPPDDDPVPRRMTRMLTGWLHLPPAIAAPAGRLIARHLTSAAQRAAIRQDDRYRSLQALHQDGLIFGETPGRLTFIPGRFLVSAQVDTDGRSVIITYGTRPTETVHLRPSPRGAELAAAVNRYAAGPTF